MSAPLIISVSGLRGEVGKTLTPEVAVRYAIAFSLSIPGDGPFVITWDGRNSGSLFADAISAALNAVGRSTLVGGVAATPTCGVLVRSLVVAVQIERTVVLVLVVVTTDVQHHAGSVVVAVVATGPEHRPMEWKCQGFL